MHPLQPRFCFQFRDQAYRFVNDMRAWFLYEARTGRNVGDVAGSARRMRTLLWSLLQAEHPNMSEGDVGGWPANQIAEALPVAALCLRSAIPDEPEETLSPDEGGIAIDASKPTDWYHLWSSARFDLGLSDPEFWTLHPLQYHALQQRFKEAIDRQYYGHCITAAMVRNSSIDPDKTDPITPDLLMPTITGAIARRNFEQAAAAAQSERLLRKIKSVARAFAGAKVNI